MNITQLTNHPEQLDKETLYDLRSIVALYPYYQPARLLMLQNLYILHDPTFDEELRRAAIFLTNRKTVFDMIEASHYKMKPEEKKAKAATAEKNTESRTISLIDDFLGSLPKEDKKTHRNPTPADAAVDYVAYLLELEDEKEDKQPSPTPQLRGQLLIDDFIFNKGGKMELKEKPVYTPDIEETAAETGEQENESYFTETLAKIYTKQGRYDKALEIIKRLNLNYPKKNAYFADQIRFLEKLIINNKTNK